MKYFCVGIKGSGMSTLASILSDLGHSVSGYDDNKNHAYTEEGLEKRGITIYYDQTHPVDSDTIVTYSKAFSEDHPELVYLRSKGLQFREYNELLGDLTREFETICVSGTHGKTTTSLMLSSVLNPVVGCNYFVGDGSGHANQQNKLFVIESCEFRKHFLAYQPYVTIITNVELEHVESYNGIEDIRNTFETLANRGQYVVCCGDDENVRKIHFTNDVTYYGFNSNNDVVGTLIESSIDGSEFSVIYKGKDLGNFHIPVTGKHMVLNAMAVISVCMQYGIDVSLIKKYLREFVSPKRRFKETKIGNCVIVDDYAHHPTELRVTIEAAKLRYPDKKIIAVVKPNTYSRTQALKDDFIKVLRIPDVTYLTPITCNRETQEQYPGVSSDMLVKEIPGSFLIQDNEVDKLLQYDNAVFLFMSCANIYLMMNAFIELKKKQEESK